MEGLAVGLARTLDFLSLIYKVAIILPFQKWVAHLAILIRGDRMRLLFSLLSREGLLN